MSETIPMEVDESRQDALAAVQRHLDQHATNAIGQSQVLTAVEIALDAYEDQLKGLLDTTGGWVVLLGAQPMIVLPTKRQARHEMKVLQRMAGGEGVWRIARTQRAVLPTR